MLPGVRENLWNSTDADAAWVNALENIFVTIRGRGVQWSADDRERALRWQQTGVSLPRIVKVLEARAKAWRFLHGDASDLPIRLQFYEKAILGGSSFALRSQVTAPPGHHQPTDQRGDVDAQNAGLNELTLADELCQLLDRVPDLVSATQDLALQKAYKSAGLSIGRSLRGQTADCRDGIDPDGFEGAVERARAVIRKTMLDGIGANACQRLIAPIEQRLAAERCSARALKRRKNALIDQALSAEFGVAFPTASGWTGT